MRRKQAQAMTGDELGRLVAGLGLDQLAPLSEKELLQVEGGRARVSSLVDESARFLPTGEVQVKLPTY